MPNIGLNVVVSSTKGNQGGFDSADAAIVGIQKKTGELVSRVQSGMKAAERSTLGLRSVIEGLIDKLATGFSIDFMGRFNSAIIGISQSMSNLVRDGVAFNSNIESVTLGIAATLKDTDKAGNFSNFKDAMVTARGLVVQMKQAALESSASFEDLATTYQVVSGQMSQAGIPIRKQVDLMVLLGNAVKNAVGDAGNMQIQLITESRSLLEGQAMAGATLARRVFATDKDKEAYRLAQQNGTAYEWLKGKLDGVAAATKMASNNFGVLSSNLKDIRQQISGEITFTLFEEIKNQMREFTKYLSSGDVVNAFKPLGEVLAQSAGAMGRSLMELLPVFTDLVTAAQPMIRDLGSGFQTAMGMVTDSVKTVVQSFSGLLRALDKAGINVGLVVNACISLGVVLAGFGIAAVVMQVIAWGNVLLQVVFYHYVLGGAIGVVRAAVTLLWAAVAANPYVALGAVLVGIGVYVLQKLNPAIEESYKLTAELEKKLESNRDRNAKKAMLGLKDASIPGAENSVEESLARQKVGLDAQLSMLDDVNKRMEADEKASYDDRLANMQVFYASRKILVEKQLALELSQNEIAWAKATPDEKEKLTTKKLEIEQKYGQILYKNSQDEKEATDKLRLSEDERQAKIQESSAARALEIEKNIALSQGNEVLAQQAQDKIDAEKEALAILKEQDITRANTQDYDGALNQARQAAEEQLRIKRAAASANYVKGLNEQIQVESVRNQLGDEAAKRVEQQLAHEKTIFEAKRQQGAESGAIVEKAKALVAQLEIQEATQSRIRQLEMDKKAIQAGLAVSDTNLAGAKLNGTPNAIQAAERENIQYRIQATQQLIDKERELATLPGADQSQSVESIARLNQQMIELQGSLQRVGSFSDQLSAGLRSWAQSFGTVATQMASILTNTVGSAFQGISQSLANVIMGTQTLGQAMSQFAIQLATSFIASVIQMILIATVAIPILTALNILSGGGPAATGLVVTQAAVSAGSAMSSGFRFASGGFIPGPASNRDNRLAMVATGEHVTRSRAVSYYGAGVFDAINDMRIPRERLWAALEGIRIPLGARASSGSHFAAGGMVGRLNPNVNVAPAPLNVAILDDKDQIDRFMESKAGAKKILRIINSNRASVGIRT